MKILQSKQQRLAKQKLSPYLPMEEIATHNWEHMKDPFDANNEVKRSKNPFSKNHFESSIRKFESNGVAPPSESSFNQPKFEVWKVNDEPLKAQEQAVEKIQIKEHNSAGNEQPQS